MKKLAFYFLGLIVLFLFSECKDKSAVQVEQSTQQHLITYAKGFTLKAYDGIYVVQITQPWASAKERFTYVLKREQANVPDSLQQ